MKKIALTLTLLAGAAASLFAAQCDDGVDNDGDGLVDWQFDLGCTAQDDDGEGGLPTGTVENGWTVFEPSADSRIVYVSAAGDDAWDGLAPDFVSGTRGPRRTVAAGLALLRSGFPDWLLLRRGDAFSGQLLIRSGRSAAEPQMAASYGVGSARPIVDAGGASAVRGTVDNVAVLHLDLRNDNSLSPVVVIQGSHVTVEGNRLEPRALNTAVSGWMDNASLETGWSVRRNTSAWGDFGFKMIDGLLVEENVIYRPSSTDANHAMYITRRGNANVVTRGNVILMDKAQGNGIMQRPGGLSEGNVVVAAGWNAVDFGSCNDGDGVPCWGPIPVAIRGNLAVDGLGVGMGGGIGVLDPQTGAVVEDNMVVNGAANTGACLQVSGTNFPVDGLLVQRNLFHNARIRAMGLSPAGAANVTLRNNWFHMDRSDAWMVNADTISGVTNFLAEGNRFYSPVLAANQWFSIGSFAQWQARTGETGSDAPFTLPDGGRSLARYNREVLGRPPLADDRADREDFFLGALNQRKFGWDPRYDAGQIIAWFRAGLTPASGPADSTPPARPRGLRIR